MFNNSEFIYKNFIILILFFLISSFAFASIGGTAKKNKVPCALLAKSDSAIKACGWSPDGDKFFTAWENTLLVWDAIQNKPVKVCANISSPVVSISFSHDGKYFVVVTEDNSIIISYTQNCEEVARCKGEESAKILDAIFSNDNLSIITTLNGKQVVNCFRLILTKRFHASSLQNHKNTVYSLNLHPIENQVLSSSKDGTAQLWDLYQNQLIASYKIYSATNISAIFNPDGETFVIPEDKNVLSIKNKFGQTIAQIKEDDVPVNKIAYSPNGRFLAVALKNGGIRIYNSETGKQERNLDCIKADGKKTGSITDFAFSPDGSYIVGCTDKGCVYRWSLSGKVFAQSTAEKKLVENQIQNMFENGENVKIAEYSQIDAVAEIPKENKKNADNGRDNISTRNDKIKQLEELLKDEGFAEKMEIPDNLQLVTVAKKASSALFAGVGYSIIPTDIFAGNFEGDIGFQKSFTNLPLFVALNVQIGVAIPNKNFPYNYYLENGTEISAPWLYTGKPRLAFGYEFYNKTGLRTFIEACGGPSIRFMWDNAPNTSVLSPFYYGYFAGISAGIDIKGITLKASCVYDSMFGIQNSAELGATIKFYKKRKGASK